MPGAGAVGPQGVGRQLRRQGQFRVLVREIAIFHMNLAGHYSISCLSVTTILHAKIVKMTNHIYYQWHAITKLVHLFHYGEIITLLSSANNTVNPIKY